MCNDKMNEMINFICHFITQRLHTLYFGRSLRSDMMEEHEYFSPFLFILLSLFPTWLSAQRLRFGCQKIDELIKRKQRKKAREERIENREERREKREERREKREERREKREARRGKREARREE